MKLWGGRFLKGTDEQVHQLNASLDFDRRLYREDLEGSQAWAQALSQAGVLSPEEAAAIRSGLQAILGEFEAGTFLFAPTDEDIHSAIERRLTELLGAVAGKLHTGRSRNDQVATDFRLWVMRACREIEQALQDLGQAALKRAEAGMELPMPGYTHLRRAQLTTWGHWLLSHLWALLRDRDRFRRARSTAGILPLGSGALAGTPYAIDRPGLARTLGFHGTSQNSIDAVADRDFALEFLLAGAALGVHLSRLAEALILFGTAEFGFISFDEAHTTGSSLLPHKRNPDPLELARGKSGRLIGNLTALLVALKGLPSAYDKDLQEDKEPVFDTYDTLQALLPVLTSVVRGIGLHPERMAAAVEPALFAPDLADYLVARGVPFREAHAAAGQAVLLAEQQGQPLDQLPLEALRTLNQHFEADFVQVFDAQAALARRDSEGGTSPRALRLQLEAARAALTEEAIA